jgi:hypothetical protein
VALPSEAIVPWPMHELLPCVHDLPALLNLVSLAVRSIAVDMYGIPSITVALFQIEVFGYRRAIWGPSNRVRKASSSSWDPLQ